MNSPAPKPAPEVKPVPKPDPPETPPREIIVETTEKVKAFAKEHKLPLVGVGCLIAGFLFGYQWERPAPIPAPSNTIMENQFGNTRRLDAHQQAIDKLKGRP